MFIIVTGFMLLAVAITLLFILVTDIRTITRDIQKMTHIMENPPIMEFRSSAMMPHREHKELESPGNYA